MTEPTQVTASMADQNDRQLRFVFHRLLHNLRKFVRAYPFEQADVMPEYGIDWVSGINGNGPEQVIRDAIAQYPALWAHALPDEVCIVRRANLETAGLSKHVIDYLAMDGVSMVDSAAYRRMREAEEKRREAEWRERNG